MSSTASTFDPTRLRALIEGSGRSLRELAQDSGIALANLSRICSGKADPRASTVARILTAIGADWADLGPPIPLAGAREPG